MESLIWITVARDIGPEIKTTPKILILEHFFAQLLNTKVVDNFLSFVESTRTKESEFICGRYDQNTKLDRDKSEQDDMT
jgi:hypothetical protein